MTKIVIAQDAQVLVAIEITKERHEVLIAIPSKKRRRHSALGWKSPVAFERKVA